MSNVFLLGLGQFFAFVVVTLSFRYCAKGHVWKTVLTDVVISINGFFLIKLVGEAHTVMELLAYAAGGGLGTYVAMRFTKGLKDGE